MPKPHARFYPTDNGSLHYLRTASGKHIIIDCNFREGAADENDDAKFDCKADLLKRLPTDADGRPYVDLFVLTHPDNDHCRGFEKHFYTGDPADYSDEDNEDQILINELWVTKLVTDDKACDDAKAIEKERQRRYNLYGGTSRDNETDYNRLTMIGYDSDEKYAECPSYVPGQYANHWAGQDHYDIDIFIHAPFKESLVTDNANKNVEEKDRRNNSSIVAQYTLYNGSNQSHKMEILEGGDADHYRWEKVKTISEDNGNEDRLRFDIMVTPHHCSWGFFNDRPYDPNTEPKETSVNLIKDYGNDNAYIVANSKAIKNDGDNPPHFPAKTEYRSAMHNSSNFKCTANHPKASKPEPMHFELSGGKIELDGTAVVASSARVNHQHNDRGHSFGY